MIKKYLMLPKRPRIFIMFALGLLLLVSASIVMIALSSQPKQNIVEDGYNEESESTEDSKTIDQNEAEKQIDTEQAEVTLKDTTPAQVNQPEHNTEATPAPSANNETFVPSPPVVRLPTAELQTSRSDVTLPSGGSSSHINVWVDEGVELAEPQVTAPVGVNFYVDISGGTTWTIYLSQADPNSQGQGIVKVTTNSYDPFKVYRGEILVTWNSQP